MSLKQNDVVLESQLEAEAEKDLHEEAGLVRAGLNEDGEQEWIGTDEQWHFFEQLEAQKDEA